MLETLRAQPNEVKKRVAFAFTVAVFLVIVLIWVSSWRARLGYGDAGGRALSPLGGVGQIFKGIMRDTKATSLGTAPSAPSLLEEDAREILTPEGGAGLSREPLLGATVVEATEPASSLGTKFGDIEGFDVSGIVVIDASLGEVSATNTKKKKE